MSNRTLAMRASMGQFLTEEQLRQTVPSIFATEPHSSRSHRFVQINTWDAIEELARHGFRVVQATQGRVRDLSREDFTKHSVRLRHIDDIEGRDTKRRVGDTFFEVKLGNASDGTKPWDYMAALLRLVCLNGAVVDDGTFAGLHIKHLGDRDDVLNQVTAGVKQTLDAAPTVINAVKTWQSIPLTYDERMSFAERAHAHRFPVDAEGKSTTPITPAQLLVPRRTVDQGKDLWTTFNVVQENVIRGGLTAVGRNAQGRRFRTTTREVRGIDQDTKLNKQLWALGANFAELKQAA